MNKLGVERAKDGQLVVLVELGDPCATCFADGVQVIFIPFQGLSAKAAAR
jgi:formylmethanofuran dehydrogenase subunit E